RSRNRWSSCTAARSASARPWGSAPSCWCACRSRESRSQLARRRASRSLPRKNLTSRRAERRPGGLAALKHFPAPWRARCVRVGGKGQRARHVGWHSIGRSRSLVAKVAVAGALHDGLRARDLYVGIKSLGHGEVRAADQQESELRLTQLLVEFSVAASRDIDLEGIL